MRRNQQKKRQKLFNENGKTLRIEKKMETNDSPVHDNAMHAHSLELAYDLLVARALAPDEQLQPFVQALVDESHVGQYLLSMARHPLRRISKQNSF